MQMVLGYLIKRHNTGLWKNLLTPDRRARFEGQDIAVLANLHYYNHIIIACFFDNDLHGKLERHFWVYDQIMYMRLCTSRLRLHVGTTLSRNPLARYTHVIVCLFSNQCVHGPLLNLKSRIWLPRVILWYFDFVETSTCPKNICIPCRHRAQITLNFSFVKWKN